MKLILARKGSKDGIVFDIGHYQFFRGSEGEWRFGWERPGHLILGISFSLEYLKRRHDGVIVWYEYREEPALKDVLKHYELLKRRKP